MKEIDIYQIMKYKIATMMVATKKRYKELYAYNEEIALVKEVKKNSLKK